MSLTREQLLHVFPSCTDPDTLAAAISEAWAMFGFNSRYQRAGFLGIIGNETGGGQQVKRERLNYTLARAQEIFPKARKYPKECLDRIQRGEEAFANWIYAGILGNGDEASGDGWRYRGNGLTQLTGRANHRAADKALGTNLEADPDSMADPVTSAKVAAWFMARHARILGELDKPDEASFLNAALKVGWVDDAGRKRRLHYRQRALDVVTPAGYVSENGNVRREKIEDSTIVKDSNKGATIGTIAAGATAAGPVVQAIAGADWRVGIAFAVVAGIAILGAVYYFTRIRKRRKKMHSDGVA